MMTPGWQEAEGEPIGDQEAERLTGVPYIVGLVEPPTRLRAFTTEDEAVAFVGTLEGAKDGRYYIDNMNEGEPERRVEARRRDSEPRVIERRVKDRRAKPMHQAMGELANEA